MISRQTLRSASTALVDDSDQFLPPDLILIDAILTHLKLHDLRNVLGGLVAELQIECLKSPEVKEVIGPILRRAIEKAKAV